MGSYCSTCLVFRIFKSTSGILVYSEMQPISVMRHPDCIHLGRDLFVVAFKEVHVEQSCSVFVVLIVVDGDIHFEFPVSGCENLNV